MLLVDRTLGLVGIDFRSPPIERVGVGPEEVLRLAHRDAVVAYIDDAIAELRVLPERIEVTRVAGILVVVSGAGVLSVTACSFFSVVMIMVS